MISPNLASAFTQPMIIKFGSQFPYQEVLTNESFDLGRSRSKGTSSQLQLLPNIIS